MTQVVYVLRRIRNYLCGHYRVPGSHCFRSILSLVESIRSGPGCPPTASPGILTGRCYLEKVNTQQGIIRGGKSQGFPDFILLSPYLFRP